MKSYSTTLVSFVTLLRMLAFLAAGSTDETLPWRMRTLGDWRAGMSAKRVQLFGA